MRDTLRRFWQDPGSLDPSRASARVTRQVAGLARSLERSGHKPDHVAAFITRALFSMFVEDVGLLPKGAFLQLLQTHRAQPATLQHMLRVLWTDMDSGGFCTALATQVLRFNGKLFKNSSHGANSLLLNPEQIDGLILAANSNWREVEPAIFVTLLERALDPVERHALGAHYTPRACVERLVLPTVIEPLRADWLMAQAAALVLAHEAAELSAKVADQKLEEARLEVRKFHHPLVQSGTLEDRPRYNKTRCFETLPFPDEDTGLTPELRQRISSLGEQIDTHRKRQQAASPGLTLTGTYNVLDALRKGRPLSANEKIIHTQGLVSVLKELHDELDAAVLLAYGLTPGEGTDALLTHLVSLNASRAAEEKTDRIRWLRPAFQNPALAASLANQELSAHNSIAQQTDLALDSPLEDMLAVATGPQAAQAWPGTLPDQVRAVAQILAGTPIALPQTAIEACFKGRGPWKKSLPRILDTLEALGRARREGAGWLG